MIWLILAVMMILALAVLFWRRGGTPPIASDENTDVAVYRSQLDELDRDEAQGLIGAAEAAQAKTEVKRRLLKAAQTPMESATNGGISPQVWGGLVVVIMLGVASLYFSLGRPELPDFPRQVATTDALEDSANGPTTAELISRLEARLATSPDEAEGWMFLGRLRGQQGDYLAAAKAFEKAAVLAPEEGDVQVMYAESLLVLSDGQMSPAVRLILDRAALASPGHPGVEYYLGLADYQADKKLDALARWQKLLEAGPDDAPWRAQVERRVRMVTDEIGVVGPAKEVKAPALSQEQIEDVQSLSQDEQMAMIRGMVAQLAARLEQEPDDLEGWLRLGRAYLVLDEQKKALEAYDRALEITPPELKEDLEKQVDILRARQ